MRKKYIWISLILIVLISLIVTFIIYLIKEKEIPVDNSAFTLVDDMTIEVYSDLTILSKIKKIDGELIQNSEINTDTIGTQTIEFVYRNSQGKKRRGCFDIEIIDTTKPIVLLKNSYSVTVGYDKKLTDVILAADNYDKNPKRNIIGEYNLNVVGNYPLTYQVIDQSGNTTSIDFTLYVKEKSNVIYSPTYTNFDEVIETYKTSSNQIGIDVSKWQGNINFKKIKEAGVEFMIIRVGTGLGFGKKSVEDAYFKQNIESAIQENIPVGIYYYSYATTKEEAQEQALWVLDLIKDYKIDLPVAFDWESWSYFNGLNMSLYDINEVANTFLTTIESEGYQSILYGSKYYLQNIWARNTPVWLAHYTTKTDYEKEYKLWQLCDNGKVDGINGYVDIDIMYE